MNAAVELTTPLIPDLENKIAELQEIIVRKDKELARVADVTLNNRAPVLRSLLDRIHALDIDTTLKREMTDTCLRLLSNDTKSRRLNIELTENDAVFVTNLEKKYPALNPQQVKICLLVKLNYENRAIAHITGINIRGMESLRYRVHKKLGLQKHESMKNYLAALAVI